MAPGATNHERCLAVLFCALTVNCGGAHFVAYESSGGDSSESLGGDSSADTAGSSGSDSRLRGAAGDSASSSGDPPSGAGTGSGGTAAQGGATSSGGGTAQAGSSGASGTVCGKSLAGPFQLGFFPELSAASTQEIHPFFDITSDSDSDTVSLDRVAIRYYFTKEAPGTEVAKCYWLTGDNCKLADLSFHDQTPATATANRYLELRFPKGSRVLVGGTPFEARVGFNVAEVTMLQTNDYSFDPNASALPKSGEFPYKRWPKVALYIDGQLSFGTEPCAATPTLDP